MLVNYLCPHAHPLARVFIARGLLEQALITWDHHTHHSRCGHAQAAIRDYIEAALALGLEEVGITDHAPLYWREGNHPVPGSAMARSELPVYVDEVLALREEYAPRIRVLLGLESDYAPGWEETYRDVFASYPFDYVIGSVHYSHGFHIYDRRRWNSEPDPAHVYREYFRLVRESAQSGLFDVLGHITGIMAQGTPPPPDLLAEEFEKTADAIAASGVAIEVNASGLRKGRPEPFPDTALLRLCLERGVPVTYGSDCHFPHELGHARDTAWEAIRGARLWRPTR